MPAGPAPGEAPPGMSWGPWGSMPSPLCCLLSGPRAGRNVGTSQGLFGGQGLSGVTGLSAGGPLFLDLATHPPLPPPVLLRGPGSPRVSKHTSLQGEWDLPPTFSSAFPAGNDHWVRTGLRSKEVLIYACIHAKSLQSCPTLCDPVDCSPPGSSFHGILQARILERVAISFSYYIYQVYWASLVSQTVKNPPAMHNIRV